MKAAAACDAGWQRTCIAGDGATRKVNKSMPTDLHRALQRKAARKNGEWSLLLLLTLGLCVFTAGVAFESPAFAAAIRWAGIN